MKDLSLITDIVQTNIGKEFNFHVNATWTFQESLYSIKQLQNFIKKFDNFSMQQILFQELKSS